MKRSPLPNPTLYEMSGPLGADGDNYSVRLCGPTINAASFRQLIRVLTMTAEWLEEDEAAGIEDPVAVRLRELAEDTMMVPAKTSDNVS